ncbi:hypothetical protein CPB85DRAFT_893868 [Mucidula mucida]|nr:hypothetical protein CPB85DRAFT_893868 [Mucidula mucida]
MRGDEAPGLMRDGIAHSALFIVLYTARGSIYILGRCPVHMSNNQHCFNLTIYSLSSATMAVPYVGRCFLVERK